MKIFLAGIIQGSLVEAKIHQQDWREPIKRALARHLPKAEVYCHYTAHPGSIAYDLPAIRETLTDGIARAAACDLLIAFVPSASMGTAIEMYEAARAGAVVLTVTPLKVNWVIRTYSDRIFGEIEELEAFLASPEFPELIEQKRDSGFGIRVSGSEQRPSAHESRNPNPESALLKSRNPNPETRSNK